MQQKISVDYSTCIPTIICTRFRLNILNDTLLSSLKAYILINAIPSLIMITKHLLFILFIIFFHEKYNENVSF